MRENPIFILGNPRSGTTLLRLMLTSHPDICIPPECGFLQWLHSDFGSWQLQDSKDSRQIEQFVSALFETKKFETWELHPTKIGAAIRIHQPKSYPELVALIYKTYANTKNKNGTIWGDKNNYYIKHLPLLLNLFPEAFIIHIVRDVRDVICSYIELGERNLRSQYSPKLTSEPIQIAKEWIENNLAVTKNLRLSDKNLHVVRYEDLVANPELSLNKACNFLNISYTSTMLDYSKLVTSENLEPAEFLEWKEKVAQNIDDSRVGRYKKELKLETINSVTQQCKMLLKDLGYQT
jgi:hypothetical protein